MNETAEEGTGGRAPGLAAVDLKRIEIAVLEILLAIGEDPERDGISRASAKSVIA